MQSIIKMIKTYGLNTSLPMQNFSNGWSIIMSNTEAVFILNPISKIPRIWSSIYLFTQTLLTASFLSPVKDFKYVVMDN